MLVWTSYLSQIGNPKSGSVRPAISSRLNLDLPRSRCRMDSPKKIPSGTIEGRLAWTLLPLAAAEPGRGKLAWPRKKSVHKTNDFSSSRSAHRL
jgi:hypothetical protein